jgi:hypothetical protein
MSKIRTIEIWTIFVIVLTFFAAFFGTVGVKLLMTDDAIFPGLIILVVTIVAVIELFIGFKKLTGKKISE